MGGPVDVGGVTAAVVTVTFNRAEYLQRHVDSLLAVHARERGNRRVAQAGLHECLHSTAQHRFQEHAQGTLTGNLAQQPSRRRVTVAEHAFRRSRAI